MSLAASFAPSLRSGLNDATWATNKLYALQKSCQDCPILIFLENAGECGGKVDLNHSLV